MAMREHIAGDCSSDFALAGNFPFGSPESRPYASRERVQSILQTSTPDAALYVEAYFRVYNPSLPVLDLSAFTLKMKSFYDSQDIADPSWLAQYFVVLGLGAYATTRNDVAASEYFYASEACLAKTSYMYRPLTIHINTLCLMVMAKSVAYATCWALDTSWNVMGLVVRLSMTMMLHKDWMPGLQEPAIACERQIRRLLWAAVVYLDIQMSLITGQQSLLPQDVIPIGTERRVPVILEDCFESILPQSFSVICHFLVRINSQLDQITYEEAMQYDLELRQLMRQTSGLPGNEHLRSTLDVFFRRALSVLHGHYALARDAALIHPVSYWSSLECNFAMMRHHQNLGLSPEQGSDLRLVAQPYMLDFLAAALTACVHLLSTAPPANYPLPDRQTILGTLKDCVELIGKEESKSLCFRTGYHLLSAVFDLTCR
ncbi:uncharacterized protein ALTATR162_LOCUS5660 [Alternaria atra]|uniref:Xylanolytic transcriptional activator regulatory domain-containing protein n=1 Tax=Alternaria atra TaxID=119953 RepID=A0A8J2I0H7_9PLEO|nr:uncharacterized protein ALTATR162_LOCUS5660 [Alternaria atra]CAG5159721.1 unnamed protein product [Alternaria atra]